MATSRVGLASPVDIDSDHIRLIIRFNGNQVYSIDTSVRHTVSDVKRLVAEKANIAPKNINLVLAGQLLHDDAVLEDCGLGSHTTLHAFCWSDDGLVAGDLSVKDQSKETLRPKIVKQQNVGDEKDEEDQTRLPVVDESRVTGAGARSDLCNNQSEPLGRSRFFVYCKICECVRPAKLRLSCKECGSGAFLVNRGPCNWDDISPSTTISGNCKSSNCSCKIPRFYLRCCQSHEGNVEGTAVVLRHVQGNCRRVECIICGDIMSHVLIFPCSPGHVICLDCFRQYSSTCLGERRFIEHPQHGYTLPCPAGCIDSHIEENHHFLLMGQEKYERYKNFGAEEYVLQNGGILCPGPGCGMGLFPEGEDHLVKCGECQFESCKECRREYHRGPCEEYLDSQLLSLSDLTITDERAERAQWERDSLNWIGEATKPCPGCHTKTERSGGCMHMVCSRCQTEWCWICVKRWTRDCQSDHWFG